MITIQVTLVEALISLSLDNILTHKAMALWVLNDTWLRTRTQAMYPRTRTRTEIIIYLNTVFQKPTFISLCKTFMFTFKKNSNLKNSILLT